MAQVSTSAPPHRRRGPGRPVTTGKRNIRVKSLLFEEEKRVFDEVCRRHDTEGATWIRNAIMREADRLGIPVPRVPTQPLPLDLAEQEAA